MVFKKTQVFKKNYNTLLKKPNNFAYIKLYTFSARQIRLPNLAPSEFGFRPWNSVPGG